MSTGMATFFTIVLIVFAVYGMIRAMIDVNRLFKRSANKNKHIKRKEENLNENKQS